MKSKTVTITLALALLAIPLCGQETRLNSAALNSLQSDDEAARTRAVQEILHDQSAAVEQVSAIVRKYASDPAKKGTVKSSMELLGKLRAKDAVPLLVDNLTFAVFYKNTKALQNADTLYPAVSALIEIGMPAIEPVLARVEASSADADLQAGAAVLRGVLGAELAAERLRIETAKASSDPARARLTQMAEMLREKGR
jgi:hypothetical protein